MSQLCADVTNAEWRMLFEECNAIVNGRAGKTLA